MTPDTFQRKLTAILSADVVGYSRLMGDDEEATVRTLNKYKQIIFDLIKRHNGRLVDSPGDNVLAEFASVVDAVRCGVQIQEDLKENNAGLPPNREMEFRIGINTGDVIQDGDRIYGDGVNVAARIESLADAGGICLSRTAYDQVKKKLNYEYEYLGEYEVKNIDEPVRVYRVQMESEAKTEIVKRKEPSTLSEKPSIVVLPFINISGDPEQEYFSDGMTEELINALVNVEGLKVISRTSSFYFKGEHADLRTIGERLNVKNVLEGSVRKAGNRLRITAQLIKVADDTHLWSETYNRELEDVFAIQDEISQAIAEKLRVELTGVGRLVKRHTDNVEAYNLYLKGRYHFINFTPDSTEKIKEYFEKAVAIDPNYALAWFGMAQNYWLPGYTGTMSAKEIYEPFANAALKALELDETLPEAHGIVALSRAMKFDWEKAERGFHQALELGPKGFDVWMQYGIWCLTPMRRWDEAIVTLKKALDLEPLSRAPHHYLGMVYFAMRQYDRAIERFRNALELVPHSYLTHVFLGITYIEMGMNDEGIRVIEAAGLPYGHLPIPQGLLGFAYARADRIGEARKILMELQEQSQKAHVPAISSALIYQGLGKTDQAFDWLEKATEEPHCLLLELHASPIFDSLHSLPRYKALLRKMNLEP